MQNLRFSIIKTKPNFENCNNFVINFGFDSGLQFPVILARIGPRTSYRQCSYINHYFFALGNYIVYKRFTVQVLMQQMEF